mmetsp:Transcript_21562/g.63202  ORF Transcript_21562/g.63202 Transcript_21562/m.63202 type:complete len:281 (-) Transcript_21562:680-1522(-)
MEIRIEDDAGMGRRPPARRLPIQYPLEGTVIQREEGRSQYGIGGRGRSVRRSSVGIGFVSLVLVLVLGGGRGVGTAAATATAADVHFPVHVDDQRASDAFFVVVFGGRHERFIPPPFGESCERTVQRRDYGRSSSDEGGGGGGGGASAYAATLDLDFALAALGGGSGSCSLLAILRCALEVHVKPRAGLDHIGRFHAREYRFYPFVQFHASAHGGRNAGTGTGSSSSSTSGRERRRRGRYGPGKRSRPSRGGRGRNGVGGVVRCLGSRLGDRTPGGRQRQ